MSKIPAISDHLAAYGQVDIAFDCFPYNGGTTSLEALWMGVPVIALRGDRFISRMGASLLTQLDAAENRQRLRWVLARGRSYVGLAAVMGSRFTQSEPHLEPILEEVKDRGLMFVDNQATEASAGARLARSLGLPHAVNDRMLDDGQASHVAIDARLAQIERLARANGAAVAMGRPYPATLERLRAWVRSLDDRGFVLVPITALAKGGGT